MGATGILASGVAGGVGTLASAGAAAEAAETQSEIRRKNFELNARLAEFQAADVILQGEKTVQDIRKKGRQIIGEQRTAIAAGGIDLGVGSAIDVQADTAAYIEGETIKAKNNAWREAFGFKVQALDLRGQSEYELITGREKARTTLVTGGLTAARQVTDASGSAYAEYKRGKRA